MPSPQPLTIDIHKEKVDLLQRKTSLANFPDELKGADWGLGCPVAEVKRLITAWEKWDWRVAQEELNHYPQFHTSIEIDGFGELNIHFLHKASTVKKAGPLLFVHGWPGSFIEVLKILPLLTRPDSSGPSFHVVAPSLPNFGFSQGVSKRGFALSQYAETCHKIMLQLGYDEYVTQAGDWGFWITRTMGRLYPEHCKASYVNMIYASAPSFCNSPMLALQHSLSPYTAQENQGLERTNWFLGESRGYNVLQSAKPQTVSYALQDSPVALLSWIYEKLHDWSDAYPWTDDEILTWVSIYAFSRAGPGAAHRIYYEVMHDTAFPYEKLLEYTPKVKLGLTYNPKELEIFPRTWGRTLGDVVFETENQRGGHFYAYECPELLVQDVKTMFGKGGGAYGVVGGKDGYDDGDRAQL